MQLPRRRRRSAIWLVCRALIVSIGAALSLATAGPACADGIATPEAYHWVSPPPGQAVGNQAPASGAGTVTYTGGTSDPASVFTDDGQVTLSLPQGAFAPAGGQTGVRIAVTPVRPQPGAPPGHVADGNAYSITATYAQSGAPAVLLTPALLDMRYPPGHHPENIYRIDGTGWTSLDGSVQTLLLTIDTRISQTGSFVAGHPAAASNAGRPGISGALFVVALAVVLAGVLLLIAGVRFRRSR
jgi:hypothetical protein